jgi:hypothetical protein
MTNHPTADWDFDDTIEDAFQEWFNDLDGGFSLRSEWFYGDAEVEDVKTRQDLMHKWLHSAFVVGYNMGRMEGLEVGLTNND